MNEEDLYNIAKDELNSRNRKPDLWARACALATDDVDEARYLYTNLRVDELAHENNIDLDAAQSEPVELSMLDTVDLSASRAAAGSTLQLDADLLDGDKFVASDESQETLQLDTGNLAAEDLFFADDAQQTASASGRQQDTLSKLDLPDAGSAPPIGRNPASGDSEDDLELTEIEGLTPAQNALRRLKTVTVPAATDTAGITAEDLETNSLTLAEDEDRTPDDLESRRLDAAITNLEDSGPSNDNTTHLENQQLGLESGNPETVNPETVNPETVNPKIVNPGKLHPAQPDTEDDTSNAEPLLDTLAADLTETDEPTTNLPDSGMATGALDQQPELDTTSQTLSDSYTVENTVDNETLDTEQSALGEDTIRQEVNSDSGSVNATLSEAAIPVAASAAAAHSLSTAAPVGGRLYGVYQHDNGKKRAVKRGGSWSATLLTLPWLFSRGLLGTAIVYSLLWLVLLGALVVIGIHYLDHNGFASMPAMLISALIALLAVVGLFVLPFRYANRWHASKLERKGYDLQYETVAKNAKSAVLQDDLVDVD